MKERAHRAENDYVRLRFSSGAAEALIPGIGEILLLQEDRALRTIWVEGSTPGESGVLILSMQFEGGVHWVSATDVSVDV